MTCLTYFKSVIKFVWKGDGIKKSTFHHLSVFPKTYIPFSRTYLISISLSVFFFFKINISNKYKYSHENCPHLNVYNIPNQPLISIYIFILDYDYLWCSSRANDVDACVVWRREPACCEYISWMVGSG